MMIIHFYNHFSYFKFFLHISLNFKKNVYFKTSLTRETDREKIKKLEHTGEKEISRKVEQAKISNLG